MLRRNVTLLLESMPNGGVIPGHTTRNVKDLGGRPEGYDFENRGVTGRRNASAQAVATHIGGGSSSRTRNAVWHEHKLDLPNLTSGMEHDFAISFPNPLRPGKCYSWDHNHMEQEAFMMEPAKHADPIPALFRVHVADLLVHDIDESGEEIVLSGDDPDLEHMPMRREGFLHFHLYKEGLRTTQAVYFLARVTGLPLYAFSWSVGMDAKAATTQKVSVVVQDTVGETYAALKRIRTEKTPRGVIHIGSVTHADSPVTPGSSRGKRVAMLLRNARGSADEIYNRIETLGYGFVNFFGVEKFGMTQGPRPHQVSVEILCGRYKQALLVVLEMEAFMNPSVERILKNITTHGTVSEAMIQQVPSHLPHVRALIIGLLKHKSFKKAYYSVAPAMRRMWETSLSSMVWNQLATTRMEKFGRKVVVGDTVWLKEEGCARVVTAEDVQKETFTVYDLVLLVPGVPPVETDVSFFPQMEGCDFNTVLDIFQQHGVSYPFRLAKEHEIVQPVYRHLIVTPLRLESYVFEGERVNERVLITDPHADYFELPAGQVASVNEKAVSWQHPLQARGLAGMMYTFDWNCVECGTRNVFLKDKCDGCEALKDLSVSLEEKQRQKALNGDLKNCNTAYVSFAIPHTAYPSVAVRDAFELHPWRFYPDGYFYQDILEPLLKFHLDKGVLSLPPSRDELKRDTWAIESKNGNWTNTKLSGLFELPPAKIDQWYKRYGHSVHPNTPSGRVHYSQQWKAEGEAWWNIPLDSEITLASQHVDPVASITGGSINVTKRMKEGGRSVPPERFTLPITPLPAAVRNTVTQAGLFSKR